MSGTLMIVGGAQSASQDELLPLFIDKAGNGKIAWIVTATGPNPDQTFAKSKANFTHYGFPDERCVLVPLYAEGVLDERGYNAGTGDNESLLEVMEGVTGVWFTGGSQYNTCKALMRPDGSDTLLLKKLREIYASGGILGGSSAGAAIMSKAMICWGDNGGVLTYPTLFGLDKYKEAVGGYPHYKPLVMAHGLGFFEGGLVDQHFNTRPRMLRSIEACFANPEGQRVMYSISEDTAMVYSNGSFTVGGTATVYVFDCRNGIRKSAGNYENITMYALNRGDSFNTETMTATLLKNERADTKTTQLDYASGCITNNPCFDGVMYNKLILGTPSSLYHCPRRNKDYVKGEVIYDSGDALKMVTLKYFRGVDTEGYKDVHTSFTNVEIAVVTKEIEA